MRKLFLLFFLIPCYAMAQQNNELQGDSLFIKMMSNNIFSSSAAYENILHLTKQIGARLAGSPQMAQAENWGAQALKKAGADTVMLQPCNVPHWVRGGTDKAVALYKDNKNKPHSISLNILALGNSIGTGAKGIAAPLIRINSFTELEQKKDSLKGKIVFYNIPFEDSFIRTFQAYGKNVIYRGSGASRAAKYGALAVIVRSMTNSMDNVPHTGALRYDSAYAKIPAAAIGLRDVEKLDSLFDAGYAVNTRLFTYGKMLPDTIAHNVVGELTGTDFPKDIITVGGHLDSWDVGEGAQDDGAGVVQTIEILRAFKALGYKPKHTIRFVLFANEENGQRGGKEYAAQIAMHKENAMVALESDAGGFTPRGFGFTVKPESWEKINTWKKLFEPYDADKFKNGGGGTDIEPLHEQFNTPLISLNPDSQRYFDVHHSTNDVLESVSIRELKLGAINMAALLYLVDKYGL